MQEWRTDTVVIHLTVDPNGVARAQVRQHRDARGDLAQFTALGIVLSLGIWLAWWWHKRG
jgi:hypothetical protein